MAYIGLASERRTLNPSTPTFKLHFVKNLIKCQHLFRYVCNYLRYQGINASAKLEGDILTLYSAVRFFILKVSGGAGRVWQGIQIIFSHERDVRRLNRAAGGVMVAAGVAIATRS